MRCYGEVKKASLKLSVCAFKLQTSFMKSFNILIRKFQSHLSKQANYNRVKIFCNNVESTPIVVVYSVDLIG